VSRPVLINNPPAALFTPCEKTERNNSMKINTSRKAGFTLVEIMIVVAIIGLLAAIAIPNFVKARESAQAKSCVNNLRQIDGAVDQYALEAGLTTGDAAPMASPGILDYLKAEPTCPVGDTVYPAQVVGTPCVCSSGTVTHVP
jgi:prepilin-type N-terminal cleavage/methylation domain-containing protein